MGENEKYYLILFSHYKKRTGPVSTFCGRQPGQYRYRAPPVIGRVRPSCSRNKLDIAVFLKP